MTMETIRREDVSSGGSMSRNWPSRKVMSDVSSESVSSTLKMGTRNGRVPICSVRKMRQMMTASSD